MGSKYFYKHLTEAQSSRILENLTSTC